jgi:positive regulator of sigma E activity
MPGRANAEIYFITAMMILILVVCGAVVFLFLKQYKKEMRERAERKTAADAARAAAAEAAASTKV